MNENIEFLNYIYEVTDMGISSISTLLQTIKEKDNKIKKVLESILKGHEHFKKEALNLIKKNKGNVKNPSLFAKAGSWMGIKMEISNDNSDSRIADMMIRGLDMGVIELDKRINNFDNNTDLKIKKIAKELKKFELDSIDILKEYL